MDTPSANIVPTEPSGGKDCTPASVAKSVAVETEPTPESRLLPEMLGAELWRTAGAESVEVSKAEFSQALETIGAKDNFGLEPGKQASERQRETFWRALHLEELAIARGCALGRESAWRCFLAQCQEKLTRAAVEMTRPAALGEELASALYSELVRVDGARRQALVSAAWILGARIADGMAAGDSGATPRGSVPENRPRNCAE